MADEATADTAAPAAPIALAPTPPWHQGVDPGILGHWQNKGYDLADPSKVAIEATKASIEASKMLGVPANELLRMPKQNAAEAEVKAFWNRLGAPADPKDYDLSGIKLDDYRDGPAFAELMRATLAQNFVPKDKAAPIINAVLKFVDGLEKADADIKTSTVETERAALLKSWGPNAEFNRLQAMQGARRWGLTPEQLAALESVQGYAAVMEKLRALGAGTTEDTFVEGRQGGGNPTTREGAQARLDELMGDDAWSKRFLAGDVQAKREFYALNEQIFGMSEAEAAA